MKINRDYFRNIIFGFEDGFVSIVGSLVGIAASAPGAKFLIISGLVIIAEGALSMAIGSYLSEKSVHEMNKNGHTDNVVVGGLFIWVTYMIAGLLVLFPYVLFYDRVTAMIVSVVITLIGLFCLGFFKGKVARKNVFNSGMEMVLIAGIAIAVGYGIGFAGGYILTQ